MVETEEVGPAFTPPQPMPFGGTCQESCCILLVLLATFLACGELCGHPGEGLAWVNTVLAVCLAIQVSQPDARENVGKSH
jgi:hypothetical protein